MQYDYPSSEFVASVTISAGNVALCFTFSNVVHVSRSGQVPDEEGEENFVVGRRIHPNIETLTDLFTGINVGLLELAEPFVFHGE